MWSGRAQRVSLCAAVSQDHKRGGFSHSNLPSRTQFRSEAVLENMIMKILFHLSCCSDKKNEFPRLFVKVQVV